MEVSIAGQSADFLLAVLYGGLYSVLYDFLGVIRNRFKSAALTFLLDTLFWLLCVVGLFWFAMGFGQGELRLFVLGGILLGSVVYFNLVGRFLRSVFVDLLELLIALLRFSLKPFRWIHQKFVGFAQKIKKDFLYLEKRNRIKEGLYTRRKDYYARGEERFGQDAKNGDFDEAGHHGVRRMGGADTADLAGSNQRAPGPGGDASASEGGAGSEARAAHGAYRV
jgi:hypothetical protein